MKTAIVKPYIKRPSFNNISKILKRLINERTIFHPKKSTIRVIVQGFYKVDLSKVFESGFHETNLMKSYLRGCKKLVIAADKHGNQLTLGDEVVKRELSYIYELLTTTIT